MGRDSSCGAWAAVVAAGSLVGGCSLAFPADEAQCSVDRDCSVRGGAFAGSVCVASACVSPGGRVQADARADAPRDASHDATTVSRDAKADTGADGALIDARSGNDWSCLGHVTYPETTDAQVRLTLRYTTFLGLKPIAGLRAEPCLRVDPTCSSPVAPAGTTDDAGSVTFALPSGYDGYVLTHWEASVPDLVYLDPPVFDTTVFPEQSLLSVSSLDAVANAIGKVDGSAITLNPADGIVFLGARDCRGALAAGVSFSLTPPGADAILVYITGGVPTLTSSETDSGGGGAYLNVSPGSVTVTTTLVATGQRIASIDGYVEANSISDFSLVPTP